MPTQSGNFSFYAAAWLCRGRAFLCARRPSVTGRKPLPAFWASFAGVVLHPLSEFREPEAPGGLSVVAELVRWDQLNHCPAKNGVKINAEELGGLHWPNEIFNRGRRSRVDVK